MQNIYAHSRENGIIFYSVLNEKISMSTYEKGKIRTKSLTKKQTKEKVNFRNLLNIAFGTIFALGNFKYCLEEDNTVFFLKLAIFLLAVFFLNALIDKLTTKGISTMKYHSAEHMCLNAYEELKKVPNLEEIKKFSIYRNTCSSNATTRMIILCTIFSISSSINFYLGLLVIFLGWKVLKNIEKKGKMNFLQKFILISPSDKELKVAIEGLKDLLKN